MDETHQGLGNPGKIPCAEMIKALSEQDGKFHERTTKRRIESHRRPRLKNQQNVYSMLRPLKSSVVRLLVEC